MSAQQARPAQWMQLIEWPLPPISLPSTKACCLGSWESGHRPPSLLGVISVIYLILRVLLFPSLKGCGGGKGAYLLTLKSGMKGLSMKIKPRKESHPGSSFSCQERANAYTGGRVTYSGNEGVFVVIAANNFTRVYIYLRTLRLFFQKDFNVLVKQVCSE